MEKPRCEGINRRPCKRCGMPISFIRGPNGKTIPAQRIVTFYLGVIRDNGDYELEKIQRDPTEGAAFVSHFETCPHANEFSGRK